ncbi:uncharacterized protein F5891DRAFT_986291 [Suillus fuscotomentosus]|uniref:Uncharacterized protein n=1 Tax=Suillus fuscotomentosus TaxID=1912939 RepID=A0AAD4DSA9_9AGAM|nr:uncharacterized protein F5891DRAFT_986291 [Suillus fuscotomentosus]KAG1892967.1 hypothetical protein F5891DRAFT_986291 [Suillus fuscotomentosus]
MPSRDNLSWSPLACSTATREKCEAWLQRRDPHAGPLMETCSSLDTFNTLAPEFAAAHRIKWMSVISKCIGPSSPLLKTWATIDVQEAFYSAFCAEQACQASLLPQPYMSKMNRAQAEISLYTVAIGIARERDFPDKTGKPLFSDRFIPPPLPDELCYYDHDIDDEANDCNDFKF